MKLDGNVVGCLRVRHGCGEGSSEKPMMTAHRVKESRARGSSTSGSGQECSCKTLWRTTGDKRSEVLKKDYKMLTASIISM